VLGGARRAADWLVPEQNPSGTVYGVILIGALLAAEEGLHESYLDMVTSALIATAVYWLAHAYATGLGRRLALHEQLTPRVLWRALAHDWALVRGASIPLLVLLFAWASGSAQSTAVSVAVWTAVASIVAFELIAGLRSRATPAELALEVGVGALIGLGILALKIVLH
jgi:hypothetical protein